MTIPVVVCERNNAAVSVHVESQGRNMHVLEYADTFSSCSSYMFIMQKYTQLFGAELLMDIHADVSHFQMCKNKSIETHGAHAGARLSCLISSLE